MEQVVPQGGGASLPQGTTPPIMQGGGMPPTPPPMMQGGGMAQPMSQPYASGGEVDPPAKKNPIKEFFSDINLVEAGLLALGVAAFTYAIYYYKFEMMMTKTGYADLNARLQKIESEHAKMKAMAEKNASGNGAVRRSRRRMLI